MQHQGASGMGDSFNSLFLVQQAGMMMGGNNNNNPAMLGANYNNNLSMIGGNLMISGNYAPTSTGIHPLMVDDIGSIGVGGIAASEIRSCDFMHSEEGCLDEEAFLASVGFSVRSSELSYVAQRLERLDNLLFEQNTGSMPGGGGFFSGDSGDLCCLFSPSSESLAGYNPADLVGWVDTVIGKLEPTDNNNSNNNNNNNNNTPAATPDFALPPADASGFGGGGGAFPGFGGSGGPHNNSSGGNAAAGSCPSIGGGVWPNFGVGSCGLTAADFILPSSNAPTTVGGSSANFGGNAPAFGGNSASFGGNGLNVDRNCANIGGTDPNIGGNCTNIRGSGPNIGGNCSSIVGNRSVICGNHPSIVGNRSDIAGNHPSIVGNRSDIGGNCPSVVGNHSDIGGNCPSFVGNCSDIGGNHPSIVGNRPNIGGNRPDIIGNGPDIGGICASGRNSAAAAASIVRGNFSVLDGFAAAAYHEMDSIVAGASFQEKNVSSSSASVVDRGMPVEKEIKTEAEESGGGCDDEEAAKKAKKRRKIGHEKREEKKEAAAAVEVEAKAKVEEEKAEEEEQELGVRMVCLLVACAQAVQNQDHLQANTLLKWIQRDLSGGSRLRQQGGAMAKVATHFAEALTIRTYSLQNSANFGECLTDFLYCRFYEACPYLKFAHFTANQAILEAFEGHKSVHIIDLNLMQGLQWPSLIQALASRPEGPPETIKLTGIGPPRTDGKNSLQEAGDRLSELAKMMNLNLRFEPVVISNLDEIQPWLVQSSPGEAVAVNSIFQLHRLLQGSDRVNRVLEWIKSLAPAGVTLTMVEQEASHNSHVFYDRFMQALHHYSAMFDSLEASLAKSTVAGRNQQQGEGAVGEEEEGEFGVAAGMYLGLEIYNVVAYEGVDRVERHEPLSQWRARMVERGFEPVTMGYHALEQSSKLVSLFSGEGYTVNHDQGCLTLSWHNQPLIASSAWHSS